MTTGRHECSLEGPGRPHSLIAVTHLHLNQRERMVEREQTDEFCHALCIHARLQFVRHSPIRYQRAEKGASGVEVPRICPEDTAPVRPTVHLHEMPVWPQQLAQLTSEYAY